VVKAFLWLEEQVDPVLATILDFPGTEEGEGRTFQAGARGGCGGSGKDPR
jgi:hypothetical protein